MTRTDGIPAVLEEHLRAGPDALIARGRMLKDGDRCTVARLDMPGGETFTVKRYNFKGPLHTAVHCVMRSRAAWCWMNAQRLITAGLPSAVPVACLEERMAGVFRLRSCLVSRFVPGRSLLDLVNDGSLNEDGLARAADQFAAIWHALGNLGIAHGDMKASNFIVDDAGTLRLIDLDGMRRVRVTGWLGRERRNDLARFMRNWQGRPEVAALFRDRIGTR